MAADDDLRVVLHGHTITFEHVTDKDGTWVRAVTMMYLKRSHSMELIVGDWRRVAWFSTYNGQKAAMESLLPILTQLTIEQLYP